MAGSSCVVVGFSFASDLGCTSPFLRHLHLTLNLAFDLSGSDPLTLVLIIGGPLILIGGGFYEVRTRRDALFPHTAFTDLTTSMSKSRIYLAPASDLSKL